VGVSYSNNAGALRQVFIVSTPIKTDFLAFHELYHLRYELFDQVIKRLALKCILEKEVKTRYNSPLHIKGKKEKDA